MKKKNSIDTKYKGYNFRSRLEARWAVYFDSIGLKWDYEVEGFMLSNNKYYLPDFYIPNFGYIEIKPLGLVTEEEIEKCISLSEIEKCHVALFEGSPDRLAYACFDRGIGIGGISFSEYTVRKWGQTPAHTGHDHLDKSDYFHENETSIEIARSKRFEFEEVDK